MKKLVLLAALTGVAACSGVTTGTKSDCFGRSDVDESFVSRNATSFMTLSTKNAWDGSNDCDFQSF